MLKDVFLCVLCLKNLKRRSSESTNKNIPKPLTSKDDFFLKKKGKKRTSSLSPSLTGFPQMALIILFEFAFSNLKIFPGKSWLLVLRQALNSYINAKTRFVLWQQLVIHYKRLLNQAHQWLFNYLIFTARVQVIVEADQDSATSNTSVLLSLKTRLPG